ncbi:MAG: polysaccharide biosynthesis tyrosine autokinase [Planctomycetia bacterium]|nr:polysaccharide biosynthesis tyrosine autokinase [Planctomycetia bacterium]
MSVGSDWNSHNATQYATGEKQSIDILAVCRHRKWTILFFMSVAAGLGYLYYTKAEPVFEASAQVLIIKQRTEAQSPLSLMDADLGYEDNMTTHAQVVQSPVIIQAAVKKDELYNLPVFKVYQKEHVAGIISESLTATRAGGRDAPDSQVLQVTFLCTSEAAAMTVVTSVLQSYQDFLGETYQSISNDTITLITQAKDQLKKELESKNREINKYEKSVPAEVKAYQNGLTKAEEELKRLYTDLEKLEAKRLDVNSLLATIESGQGQGKSAEVLLKLVELNSTFRDSRNDQMQQAGTDMILPLMIDQQAAIAKFGPSHPRVKEIEMKIKAYTEYIESNAVKVEEANQYNRQKPEQILAQYVDMLRLDTTRIDSVEKGLKENIERTKKEAEFLSSFTSELRALNDDRDNTRKLYDLVLAKFNQINLVKDHGGFNMRTIRPADTVKQVEPKLVKCVAGGGLAGFLVGLGLACLIDMADKSFRNAEQVRNELGTPLLGHIPVIPEAKRANRKKQAAATISDTILTLHKPRSTIAEAYRAVRTGLNFGVRGEGHKVVQVTSPDPGDGKSTFTANLAVSLAQTGKRVLLVDADFRRPRVAKIFGIESSLGLSGVIQGTAELPEAVVPSTVENLSLLPCGPRPANPSELLGSQQFRELVETLREGYDFVLIDTPPVLAVTDPCVVAPRVDGVILLIRITKDVRPHARRSVESLQELGANILGVVVNGVGGVRPGTGHVFSSQYGHRYASESGYYDSNAYDYDAYHHYYSEEADQGREDDPEPLPVVSRKTRDE